MTYQWSMAAKKGQGHYLPTKILTVPMAGQERNEQKPRSIPWLTVLTSWLKKVTSEARVYFGMDPEWWDILPCSDTPEHSFLCPSTFHLTMRSHCHETTVRGWTQLESSLGWVLGIEQGNGFSVQRVSWPDWHNGFVVLPRLRFVVLLCPVQGTSAQGKMNSNEEL